MTRRLIVLGVALLTAASCSSDGSTSELAPATAAVASTDEVTTTQAATTTSTVPTTGTAPTTSTAPTTAAPTTESAPSDTVPPTSDRPDVINGSASVEEDVGAPPASADCSEVPRGVTDFVLEGGGSAKDVRIFVPEELLAEPAPVVLDWHGLGSTGPQQAAYSGYETLAATEGFITVHATGTLQSWELAQFDVPGRDDLAFVDALIDTVVEQWCVDPDRVYSTGMSNGGFFTAELICGRADRIAAAVSVAGLSHAEGCVPSRAVPYIAFHGTADLVVPFDGDGQSLLAVDESLSTFFTQVIPDEFAEFAADAGCDTEPIRTEETAEVIRYDYLECDDDIPMSFYELPGSGHTWPGSPLAEQLGDAMGFHTVDVDATVDGWDFLRRFSL